MTNLIEVDREKCDGDGICAAVCPAGIIQMNEAMPEPVAGAGKLCITCGHCVAFCPTGALSHRAMKPGDCRPIRGELDLSAGQAEQFLKARRSVRVYEDRAVEKETLERLIDMARYAPTGMNSQPVGWLVIHDKGEVKKLSSMVVDWMRFAIESEPEMAASMRLARMVDDWERGIDRVCRNAPHLVLAHAPKGMPVSQSACTLALSYLELAALPFGLGACWAGYLMLAAAFWPPIEQALGLSERVSPYGAMMLGYPKYRVQRIPLRKEPRIEWR
jgi:nitroreductase/NAD-dependent dihydropyrimidine dehydrogenase PreA subunit